MTYPKCKLDLLMLFVFHYIRYNQCNKICTRLKINCNNLQVLAELESGLTPMLTGVQNNRANWQALSEDKPLPRESFIFAAFIKCQILHHLVVLTDIGHTFVTLPHTTTTIPTTVITPSVAIGNRTGPLETNPPCIEAWSSDIKLESTHLRSSQKGSSKRKSKKCSIC